MELNDFDNGMRLDGRSNECYNKYCSYCELGDVAASVPSVFQSSSITITGLCHAQADKLC